MSGESVVPEFRPPGDIITCDRNPIVLNPN